jgi:hypothetical protein
MWFDQAGEYFEVGIQVMSIDPGLGSAGSGPDLAQLGGIPSVMLELADTTGPKPIREKGFQFHFAQGTVGSGGDENVDPADIRGDELIDQGE